MSCMVVRNWVGGIGVCRGRMFSGLVKGVVLVRG